MYTYGAIKSLSHFIFLICLLFSPSFSIFNDMYICMLSMDFSLSFLKMSEKIHATLKNAHEF